MSKKIEMKKIDELTKAIRGECVHLYALIRDLKSNKLSEQAKKAYTLLRIDLLNLQKEYETARQEIAEQTKPDNENQSDWDRAFIPIVEEWLKKESNVNLKIFSFDDYIDFISSNELSGSVEDAIYQLMVIDESAQVD